MERNSLYTGRRTDNAYIYGTAARKFSVVAPQEMPDRERVRREREEREERERRRAAKHKELQRAHRANLVYTIAAVAVVIFMFIVCVQYLEMQSNVKAAADEVAALEAQLTQLTVKNDETKMEIDGSVDYDELLRVAVEELGMVYPKRSQVVGYNSAESEYVKQYQDIPSSNN